MGSDRSSRTAKAIELDWNYTPPSQIMGESGWSRTPRATSRIYLELASASSEPIGLSTTSRGCAPSERTSIIYP
jgi:hypothetical protein